jgi:hypothetical protein
MSAATLERLQAAHDGRDVAEQKRARKLEHAATLKGLYCRLGEDPELAGAWTDALERNAHLTPLNALLVAAYAPYKVAAPLRSWNRWGMRVRKGERARFYLTGKGFSQVPAFSQDQVRGEIPELYDPALDDAFPDPERVAAIPDRFRELVSVSQKPSEAVRVLAEEIASEPFSGDLRG